MSIVKTIRNILLVDSMIKGVWIQDKYYDANRYVLSDIDYSLKDKLNPYFKIDDLRKDLDLVASRDGSIFFIALMVSKYIKEVNNEHGDYLQQILSYERGWGFNPTKENLIDASIDY